MKHIFTMRRAPTTSGLQSGPAKIALVARRGLARALGLTLGLGLLGLMAPAQATTLDQVKARGTLICGANPGLPGFGMPDDKGNWTGLDVDFCRAIAAVIFDDPTKVKFLAMSAQNRYTALQSGEIDVLSRNSSWTITNETKSGLLFTTPTYYDGQSFLARKKLNIASALELNGASVCVQQGTTSELNVADYFRANGMKYESVAFATLDEAIKAYDNGRCDALTTDASGLHALRVKLAQPDDHLVLPEVISKEPLTPVVRQGDDQWFNIVKWTMFALVNAEELGVTSANLTSQVSSQSPTVKRLLGVEGDFGAALGLTKDWAVRAIRAVGNYAEMYDRNIGEGSLLKIRRGINNLWSKGGILYAPPIR